MTGRWQQSLLPSLAAALVAGCAAHPLPPPAPDLPLAFDNEGAARGAQWPLQQWYRDFASEQLNSLVDLAASNNGDLAAARARVVQADARATQAGAVLLPSVDATGTANYLAGHSAVGGGHELDWSAMLTASYEMDFWGKNRAAAASTRYLTRASRADRDTVALTTLAGVAQGYFQVLALHERGRLAVSNRDTARQLLSVVQSRFDAGVAGPIEVATQASALDAAQIAIADLEQTETQARTALALMLGRFPEKFAVAYEPLDSLKEPSVGAGLPSQLLTRRPDVAAAEENLRAGHADLLVARAAMFPSLSLTAGAGVQNPALPATVLTIPGVGPSFALGGNLIQPIFDHGRLRAQRDEVQAREVELVSVYRTVIIAALVDVENALAAITLLDRAREFENGNVAQSERAFTGAKLRYEAGSGEFLTLLEAQRTLYGARDQFIQYKLARLVARVGLCKALGGGWTQPPTHDLAINSGANPR